MPDLVTKLDEYLKHLPVIGFNSGWYGINVIKPFFSQDLC